MEFTASQVWACAAAAQRINNGYLKQQEWHYPEGGTPTLLREANKTLVKKWLRENDFSTITAADYEQGEKARNHFKTYTLLALTGKLNEFQQTAMKIAAKDTFTGRDMYDFAVISCLPSVAERDQQQTDLKREVYHSEQLAGNEGDTIVTDLVVVNCRFVPAYNKFRINGRVGESFVDFYHNKEFAGTVRIKAKIKKHRGDKTTQLNYVKKI